MNNNNGSDGIIKFIDEIISRKFETTNRGYDPVKVDETLDEIFQTFSTYISNMELLKKLNKDMKIQIDNLLDEKKKMEMENNKLKADIERYESAGFSSQMMMERMNSLEEQISKKNNNHESKGTRKI